MPSALYGVDNATDFIGKEIGVSDWITLTQEQVNMFAESTRDPDWMHIDVERSAKESPYGNTIVQGFLMMSLVIHLSDEMKLIPNGTEYGLNYGMDRTRFTSVVTVGSRVRDHVVLKSFEPRPHGRYLQSATHTLEVEGQEKPAMVADWLVLWFTELKHE
jgi:acyl dehydratase